jgi:hypothetical protein
VRTNSPPCVTFINLCLVFGASCTGRAVGLLIFFFQICNVNIVGLIN